MMGVAPDASSSNGSATPELVDAISGPQSLHRAVYARRSEYTRRHSIRIKIGTWNVAALPGTDKDLASWFVSGKGIDRRLGNVDVWTASGSDNGLSDDDQASQRLLGGEEIGLYVLGLQEVVSLNPVTQYVYADANPIEKWKAAVETSLPEGYVLAASEQMSGLLLLIFASPEVAPSIGNVSTKAIGTGVMGLLGNKGAVISRMVLGETTRLVFINSHLSSGTEPSALERRCWDAKAIAERTYFDPISHAGVVEEDPEKIGDEDFAFWFGDLNFRLDGIPGDDIRRLLMLHTSGEYDLTNSEHVTLGAGTDFSAERSSESSDNQTDTASFATSFTDRSNGDESLSLPDPEAFEPSAHDDPTSLQATLDSLLPHDQLHQVMQQGKVFHDGWREGPITFLPSYKYDVGNIGLFDSSEKRRPPSWCDRILYRTRRDREVYERRVKDEQEAREKDEEMKARGMENAGEDDEVLFDYDPDNDGEDLTAGKLGLDYDEYDEGPDDRTEPVMTKEGFPDRIGLDIYTSHQRISSSDHKPVISIFTLDYEAVVPELKAKVHAEVARELDRAENEGRPVITIVADKGGAGRSSSRDAYEPSDESIDFGMVRYLEKKTLSLTLANTGRVSATFTFVDKPSTDEIDDNTRPKWLTTMFVRSDIHSTDALPVDLGNEVTLEPGETANAVLEVHVKDVNLARVLNDGQVKLEDVLVLRVTDGRDHFIPLRAAWMPTCIGRSIEELIRVPDGGIRSFAMARSKETGYLGSIPYDLPVHWSAPKELFKLTEILELLTERVVADEQMLQSCTTPKDKPGWPFEEPNGRVHDSQVLLIVDALDTDRPILDAFSPETLSIDRLEAACQAMLHFLNGLTDGIITIPLWSRIEQAAIPSISQPISANSSTTEDDKTTLLDVLSNAPNHNICFVFLMTSLSKVLNDLSPVTQGDLEALKAGGISRAAMGALGRRSLSFRRSGGGASASDALGALERRNEKERRIAVIFGKAICRTPTAEKDKQRKALEDKQRAIVELFLRGRDDC